jgi:hypothetical protein
MISPRQTGVRLASLLPILTVALLSCGEDSNPSGPGPPAPLVYGALITPRVSMEADPLFTDGYQNLGADGFTVAHLALSWAQVEKGPVVRDWKVLDRHVIQARQRGLKLSILLEILHGGEVEVPAWRWQSFPGWEDPELGWGLNGFLKEMARRSQGTVAYLWLGEGADRYADASLEDDGPLLAFLSAVGDSARVYFPGARIGTLVDPATVLETGREPLIRALSDSLDLLGFWFKPDVAPGGAIDPQTEMTQIKDGLAPWSDRPLAVLELGYPSTERLGSSEEEQAEFASLVAQWLHDRPRGMEFFCWSPLHDAAPSLADSLALQRYPSDFEGRTAFAALLSCAALRRNDGSPKAGRQRFFEERP